MRLRALLALGLACAWLGLVSPVSAGARVTAATLDYPVTTCATLAVSTTTPTIGESITVTGKNFDPTASVHLILKSVADPSVKYSLGTATTDSAGSFSTDVTMPDPTTGAGNYNILATSGATQSPASCPADPLQLISLGTGAASASAGGGAGGGSGGGTAFTGVDVLGLLVLAGILVVGGVLLNQRGGRATRARV
jgi:hypothetical protein